jgi:ribose-phosphate pyrophosphokinase
VVLALPTARHLAAQIAMRLSAPIEEATMRVRGDGTLDVSAPIGRAGFAGRTVVLVAGVHEHPQDDLVALLLLSRLARDLCAVRVIGCLPYLPYGRGDWRESAGTPSAARLMADLLRAGGLDAVVTLDPHSPQLEGFFSMPLIGLEPVEIFDVWLRSVPEVSMVVAPDAGGYKRARRVAEALDADVIVLAKRRTARGPTREGTATEIAGLAGASVLLVDDAVISGATLGTAAAIVRRHGAADVVAMVTHCPPIPGGVTALGVSTLVTTDSFGSARERPGDGALVVPAAPALALALSDLMAIGPQANPF